MGILGQAALGNIVSGRTFLHSAFSCFLAQMALGLKIVHMHRNLKIGHGTQ